MNITEMTCYNKGKLNLSGWLPANQVGTHTSIYHDLIMCMV